MEPPKEKGLKRIAQVCCGTKSIRKRWAVALPLAIGFHYILWVPVVWLIANFIVPGICAWETTFI